MPSIYDIAKICGVSSATVSRALNGHKDVSRETKARILAVCEELSYRPGAMARGLSVGRSWTIGVVFRSKFTHPLFQDVLSSFKEAIEKDGYELLFFNQHVADTSLEPVMERAKYRKVDGLLLTGLPPDGQYIQTLKTSEIPCVAININLEGPRATYVTSDSYQGSIMAMNFFYASGHRKIGLIGQNIWSAGHDRCRGYLDSMKAFGLPLVEEWMVYGDFWEEDGYQGALQILQSRELPTAVFCTSDTQAVGAIQAFAHAGLRVGADISVIGFDDIALARHTTPAITTMRQDKKRLGQTAADLLTKIIDGKPIPTPLVIPTELVVRESVATLK